MDEKEQQLRKLRLDSLLEGKKNEEIEALVRESADCEDCQDLLSHLEGCRK